MTRYIVTSPHWEETERILDDGTGPLETMCEYAEVEASSKRHAKILAIREWGKKTSLPYATHPWVETQRSDGMSPFTGLKVATIVEIPRWSYVNGKWQIVEYEERIQ